MKIRLGSPRGQQSIVDRDDYPQGRTTGIEINTGDNAVVMPESIPSILSYSYYYIAIRKRWRSRQIYGEGISKPSTDSGHIVHHHLQVANAASL